MGFVQLLKSVCLCLSLNLGNFQPLFLEDFFSPSLFLFWYSEITNVRPFVTVPHISEALFFFFLSLFSHCFSHWVISNVLFSSSLSSLSCL